MQDTNRNAARRRVMSFVVTLTLFMTAGDALAFGSRGSGDSGAPVTSDGGGFTVIGPPPTTIDPDWMNSCMQYYTMIYPGNVGLIGMCQTVWDSCVENGYNPPSWPC